MNKPIKITLIGGGIAKVLLSVAVLLWNPGTARAGGDCFDQIPATDREDCLSQDCPGAQQPVWFIESEECYCCEI